VQAAQFGTRVGAELVGELALGAGVGLQCLGAAARAGQRAHVDRDERLDQRVLRDQLAHRADDVARPAQPQLGLRPRHRDVGAPLHPALAHPLGPLPRNVGERRAAPQVERLAQHVGAPLVGQGRVARSGSTRRGSAGRRRGRRRRRAGSARAQQQPGLAAGVVEHLADAADVDVQRVPRAVGLGRAPHPVDDGVHRNWAPGIDRQRRQYSALTWRAGFDPDTPGPDLDRSENPKLH
jgi:hypothetical protein